MGGWVGGWVDGLVDGWVGRWMDGWVGGMDWLVRVLVLALVWVGLGWIGSYLVGLGLVGYAAVRVVGCVGGVDCVWHSPWCNRLSLPARRVELV